MVVLSIKLLEKLAIILAQVLRLECDEVIQSFNLSNNFSFS